MNKKRLIKLQKILMPTSPDRLIYNKKILYVMARSEADSCLRIFKDSILIITQTTNPKIFFSRYNLMLEQAEKIDALSEYVKFNGIEKIKSVYQEALNDKQNQIHQMINRYWNETVIKAESLKTDSGKEKRYQKFYNTLEQYKIEMSEENIGHYISKYTFAPL